MHSPRRNLYIEASESYLIRILSSLCFTLIHAFLCFICSPLAPHARSTHTLAALPRPPRQPRARAVYRGLLCAYSAHGADARWVGPEELVLPCIFDEVLGGAFVTVVV
jgi:hypothetical protein